MSLLPPGPRRYTALQRRALEEAVRSGAPLLCPECGTPMDRRPVPPRADVPYVRDRVWLTCPSCGRTLVVDRPKG